MFKAILFMVLLAAGSAFAQEDTYVNDCDHYGRLAYTTMYIRSTPVTFEDGVKRLMTRDEFTARFKILMARSNISESETDRLLKDMLEAWDTETTNDPVYLYNYYRDKCETR